MGFSFDRQTGDLSIGDVGERAREEINIAIAPNTGRQVNCGWRLMEGFSVSTHRVIATPAAAQGTYFYADISARDL